MVLGVSPDSVEKHRRFRKRFKLPFRLVADTDHAVAEAYGVWKEKRLFGHRYMGIVRTTFLIGARGKILRIWDDIDVLTHADEVAAELQRRRR